ncbi:vacuolar protein sorting-associated protein IST1-like isoform X2 [Bidens hawaiensis]|uniref:vacuolar protein sorting-associated protein IST1-like isoform X2 n=1 Tax=Bidens hawaiensis TaxID=980011 RepID=UPI00404941C3
MFNVMFGWSKASKCKKLMKKLRCRLKLLKNKRCCIVRQLRNDVAQLIKHGHRQTAFNRVDQIYKDECIIAVYDLLAHFCEFLSHQLPYIRRSKDCPNDINEAISSLIFASARCGDLPELVRIHKLFSKRYGEHFEARALGLLPGNLVNFQIRDNLSINKVPNQVKYKLVEEITTTVLKTGPLALEFSSKALTTDVEFPPNRSDFDHQNRSITYHVEPESSSSKNSTINMPKDIIYLEDIQEFKPPLKDNNNGKDRRVFMFTTTHKSINLLVSIIGKVGDSMKIRTGTRTRNRGKNDERSRVYSQQTMINQAGHEKGIIVKPIGEPSRVMSMPCNGWKKRGDEDGVMRSYSFPVQESWSHVHPKLPDYDELAAKFMALKKEKFQNHEICSV